MDRRAWLEERRAATRSAYDADAPTYDLDEYQGTLHRRFVDRLLDTCPTGGVVLDAPCGTGHYFAQVVESGRRVVGIDQSTGMLDVARARGLAEVLQPAALQDLAFAGSFDAAMCIDAMENVGPEDWPLVLANLRRAVKPGGFVYLTVEEQAQPLVDAAYASQVARGLPVVRGEVVDGDAFAGYHYYPDRTQVVAWLDARGPGDRRGGVRGRTRRDLGLPPLPGSRRPAADQRREPEDREPRQQRGR